MNFRNPIFFCCSIILKWNNAFPSRLHQNNYLLLCMNRICRPRYETTETVPSGKASVKKERNESMRTHGKDERPKGRGGKPELSSSFRKRPENGLVDPIPKTRQWCFILTPWKREDIRSHSHVWLRSYSVSETESAEQSRQPRGMRRIG